VALWVDEAPDERGRYGASLIFVCWNEDGSRPVGHVETQALVFGRSPEEASARLEAFSLYDVKAALDAAIAAQPEPW
jgi:hypothetical protein